MATTGSLLHSPFEKRCLHSICDAHVVAYLSITNKAFRLLNHTSGHMTAANCPWWVHVFSYSLYHSLDYKTLDNKKLMQNHLDFISSTQILTVKLLWDGSSNLELSRLLNVLCLSLCDSWLYYLLFDWMLAVRMHASHISQYPTIVSYAKLKWWQNQFCHVVLHL